ncbi:hypothetical protein JB92DRAFT_3100003 [Gautieria morchelliformis]|nr:hypothetical protein JB92DRAFT_3100003 [Gautieria morchelliformis]
MNSPQLEDGGGACQATAGDKFSSSGREEKPNPKAGAEETIRAGAAQHRVCATRWDDALGVTRWALCGGELEPLGAQLATISAARSSRGGPHCVKGMAAGGKRRRRGRAIRVAMDFGGKANYAQRTSNLLDATFPRSKPARDDNTSRGSRCPTLMRGRPCESARTLYPRDFMTLLEAMDRILSTEAMLYDMGPALLVAHSTVQKGWGWSSQRYRGGGANGSVVSYVLQKSTTSAWIWVIRVENENHGDGAAQR